MVGGSVGSVGRIDEDMLGIEDDIEGIARDDDLVGNDIGGGAGNTDGTDDDNNDNNDNDDDDEVGRIDDCPGIGGGPGKSITGSTGTGGSDIAGCGNSDGCARCR